jgi:hypothetical protein
MPEQSEREEQHMQEVSEEDLEAVTGGTLGLLDYVVKLIIPAEPEPGAGPNAS